MNDAAIAIEQARFWIGCALAVLFVLVVVGVPDNGDLDGK